MDWSVWWEITVNTWFGNTQRFESGSGRNLEIMIGFGQVGQTLDHLGLSAVQNVTTSNKYIDNWSFQL